MREVSEGAGSETLLPFRRAKAGEARNDDSVLERRAIVRAKQGDWDAIHYLYVRFGDEVRTYVRSIVNDHHDAEDITQSLFARLMTAIRKYEPREVGFAGWLMRVARNAAIDHLRGTRQIPVEEVRIDDPGGHANSERLHTLKEAFDQLPSDQRTVLMLRHVVGLSPPEIAERLDRSEGSIHGLHHRGRRALQQSLREMDSAPVAKPAA